MKRTPKHPDDENIIRLLLLKDERGIDALYDKYSDVLLGLIYGIVKQEDIAEIVLQDTFLKVWNKIELYQVGKSRLLTWLINIARNTAIDMLRSKYYRQTLSLVNLENIPKEKERVTVNKRVYYFDLKDIVAELDYKIKDVIELVYFQGYTCSEASKALNIPIGTVKSRIRKGIKNLRVIVKPV